MDIKLISGVIRDILIVVVLILVSVVSVNVEVLVVVGSIFAVLLPVELLRLLLALL